MDSKYFGENEDKMTPEDVFQIFNNFCRLYKGAEQDLAKLAADDERNRKREEAKAQRQAQLKAKAARAVVPDKKKAGKRAKKEDVVDQTLETLRTNDAFEIMKLIRQRRKKRGSISAGQALLPCHVCGCLSTVVDIVGLLLFFTAPKTRRQRSKREVMSDRLKSVIASKPRRRRNK